MGVREGLRYYWVYNKRDPYEGGSLTGESTALRSTTSGADGGAVQARSRLMSATCGSEAPGSGSCMRS
eukprot:1164735-Prorocentrum_minimum.AAC.1